MAFLAFVTFLISVGILLSLGTHVFWQAAGRMMLAIGALASVCGYVAAIAANSGLPAVVSLALSAACGFFLGTLVTLIGRRLMMEEFLLLALALAELVRRLAFHLESLTGGAYGLRATAAWGPQTSGRLYLLGLSAVALAWALQRWFRTPLGLQWRMVGGARQSAVLLGLDPFKTETIAGGVTGLMAGLAGAAHVFGLRYIHPDDLGMSLSLSALAVGLSARPGSLGLDACVLSAVLFGLREILRVFDVGDTTRFAVHEMVLGAVLIVIAVRLGGPRDGP